ncbi:GyrI-like domain-containing protein [Aureibacillus halotolerans]|uniref:GyrI-like small molecule binding protein n=1 Tax=Aureibacillus halotolerans TaxID=1508390 RepID=A0A4R6U4T7_9BACI|nr:GyrI-like domain-containing protein [Aureibacillus halotolerans]TDQ39813.1 hypothetical protein EV213_107181 [Aureibacillus halotolerans]
MVVIPTFHLVGRLHRIEIAESLTKAPEAAKQFWWNDRQKVLNPLETDIYYGLTRTHDPSFSWTTYLPSMRVEHLSDIPNGFASDTIPASLCVGFRYIRNHHYEEIDQQRAKALYNAINELSMEKKGKYELLDTDFYIEKIDTSTYDGQYCQMEWFAPIRLR